jgi:hypothetical protein
MYIINIKSILNLHSTYIGRVSFHNWNITSHVGRDGNVDAFGIQLLRTIQVGHHDFHKVFFSFCLIEARVALNLGPDGAARASLASLLFIGVHYSPTQKGSLRTVSVDHSIRRGVVSRIANITFSSGREGQEGRAREVLLRKKVAIVQSWESETVAFRAKSNRYCNMTAHVMVRCE